MGLIKKMDSFLKSKYHTDTDQIYLLTLVEEIKNSFKLDSEIDKVILVKYLEYKGYKNILIEFEPEMINKDAGKEEDTDSNVDFSLCFLFTWNL